MSNFTVANYELSVEVCPECCIVYGVPKVLLDRRKGDGESIFCPNGHDWFYPAGKERRDREDAPGYAEQQERLLALHTQEQLEAKVADAEARASEAEQRAKAAETAARKAQAPGVNLTQVEPVTPAPAAEPPKQRRSGSILDKPVLCPHCTHRPYRNLTCLRQHLRSDHKVERDEVERIVRGLIPA